MGALAIPTQAFRLPHADLKPLQDLFLLHDPTAGKEKRLQAWKVLIEKRDAGVLRSIGVSNFVSWLRSLLPIGESPL